jgi:hypothetical protein
MTFTVDPFNEDVAADEDGELLSSVRMLPVEDGITPTIEQLRRAPIVGYGGQFTLAEDDAAGTETSA